MEDLLELIINKYELFLIVIVRCSGIFLISPFFSSQNIPNRIKIGMTLILSIIISSTLDISVEELEMPLFVLIFKELLVGAAIGFISSISISVFYVMGQIVDMSIGFGMVNVIDPQNRVQVPLMGNFYYMLALLLLITFDGHHIIINSLVDSYRYIPVGGFRIEENMVFSILDLVSNVFVIGFKLSIPVVAIIFLLDLLLGIMVRTIPQMNVFVIGLPMKIFIGMIIIAVTIPMFNAFTDRSLNILVDSLYKFLKYFSEG